MRIWFKNRSIFLLTFVFLLVPDIGTHTQAAEETPNTQELIEAEPVVEAEEVIVSATKTPVPFSHLTSSVEVITEEDLERRKIKNVVDALRLGQGLAVFSEGGPGTLATVRIRGANASQTLVLVDGAIMNSATAGQFDFKNLTTDNIERIEILRGPQSMLWGGDAIGGVINITTKRGRGAPTVGAFFEYGSFVSLREGGTLSGQTGPLDYALALSRWDTAGFSAINHDRGAAERDGYRNWQGSTRFGLALPWDGRFEFNFRWINSFTNFDGFTFDPVTLQSNPADVFKAGSNSNQFIFAGNYEQPITNWWTQKVTLSRAQEELESEFGTNQRDLVTGLESPPNFPVTDIRTWSNRIESQHTLQVAKPLLVTGGYQFREQIGKDPDNGLPETIISSHSGFAEAQVNMWERVFATGGFRQDEFNVFGSATTWRATGAYFHKETGTKVRGSYGTGFRAPTVNELVFPGFGNPDLKPEKSQGLDVGVDQFLFDGRLTLSAVYFWNRFRDLIVGQFNLSECNPGPPNFGFCAINVGLAKSQGVEASFKYSLTKNFPYLKSLDLQGQYTHTVTRDLQLNQGNRLPRWPLHQASAILSYQPINPLHLNLEFRFVGERFNDVANQFRLESFTVFNLSASYDLNKHIQFYTRVDNLFDEAYEEVLFFGTPTRSIYGGIRTTFDVPLASS